MGVYLSHDVQINFADYDQAERYYNYVNRKLDGHSLTYLIGGDEEEMSSLLRTDPQEWDLDEIFDGNWDHQYIELNIEETFDGAVVSLSTAGYGSVPNWLIQAAFSMYSAEELYFESGACQGQEDLDWVVHFDGKFTSAVCKPNWKLAY